jgi:hypothetical protein
MSSFWKKPLGNWGTYLNQGIAYIEEEVYDWTGSEDMAASANKDQDEERLTRDPNGFRPEYLKKWYPEKYKEEFPALYAADVLAAKNTSGGNDVSDTTDTTTTTGTTAASTGSAGSAASNSSIDIAKEIELAEASAKRASEFNMMLGRTLGPEVLDQTTEAAQALDASLRAEMDKLYPGMRQSTATYSQEALDATRKAAAEFSTGNVPQDVQDYQQRLAASLGISRGAFGTAPNYGLARNLGATSLQMKQYGTELYGTIPSMSAQILQNARSMMPAMNQLPQMYDSAYARAFSASAIPTGSFVGMIGSGMETNAQLGYSYANLAQQNSQFNTELQATLANNKLMREDALARDAAQREYDNKALKATQQSQYWNTAASIIGAIGGYYQGGYGRTNNQPQNWWDTGGSGQSSLSLAQFPNGSVGPRYTYEYGTPGAESPAFGDARGWGDNPIPGSNTDYYDSPSLDQYGLSMQDYANFGLGSSGWSGSSGWDTDSGGGSRGFAVYGEA